MALEKITYTERTQTGSYDDTKHNAQDDNETKSVVNALVDAFSNQINNYKTITTAYTALIEDNFLELASGSYNVTLPSAVGIEGKVFWFKNTGTGTKSLLPVDDETIDDYESTTTVSANQYLQIVSDGANWKSFDRGNKYIVLTITSPLTLANLNSQFLDTTTDYKVYCPLITSGGLIYVKSLENGVNSIWQVINAPRVV